MVRMSREATLGKRSARWAFNPLARDTILRFMEKQDLGDYYRKAKKLGVGQRGAKAMLYYRLAYTADSLDNAVVRSLGVIKEATYSGDLH